MYPVMDTIGIYYLHQPQYMGGVPGIQLWTLCIYVVYFPQRIGGCTKLSDPTWWEVNQKWFLTDCVQYLTPQFIVGGVPAMGPYRSI